MLNINRRRSQKGFTLIELLIVVAIIGIIAAILIPNLIDSLQKAKQKRTVGDIRNIGTCWMSWLTDQISASAAGTSVRTYDFEAVLPNVLTSQELLTTLYVNTQFFYCQEVPTNDGWGNPMDFRWSGNPLSANVMGIRSGGRDGVFDAAAYPIGPFITTQYNRDVVWADGIFVHYPAGVQVVN